MQGRNSGQIDIFNNMIFEKLIPKNHLLVKIDSLIDFSFIYHIVKDKYSNIGRESKDPAMMLKICLLEYLYTLSDVEVVSRIKTDMAFRWFLGLSLDGEVPDDTTVSHFRIHRMGKEGFEEFFNEIVRICIKEDLVKKKRFIVDTTDVAANVNYPSQKRLICNAFRKVIKEIEKFNQSLAKGELKKFEEEIEQAHKQDDNVSVKQYLKIARKHIEYLYLKTYDELQTNEKYKEGFGILWDIINQYNDDLKDKIISVVDPDARVAHKSPGNRKRGYKDHIMIDEDSEIILGSVQTPFNIGDDKKLTELIEKVEGNFGLKPEEVTADKVYGSIANRAYLMDRGIVSNIDFYDESEEEPSVFPTKQFEISEDLKKVTCPNGITTEDYKITTHKASGKEKIVYKFNKKACQKCPLKDQCLRKNKNKLYGGGRKVEVTIRHDAVINDIKHVQTSQFKEAINKRYKIERRFATMVSNHGLRRCRYLKLTGAKIHITLANTACNIIRMVNLLCHPNLCCALK